MSSSPRSRERGIAVVVALLVLALLSIMGISLINLSLSESQIGSNETDLKKAFFAAEAGIQEVMYRMRLDPTAPLPAGSDEGDTACSITADPVVIGFVQGGALTIPSPDPGNTNFWKYNTPTGCSWTYTGSNSTGYGNYFGGIAANLDTAGRTFASSGAAHAVGAPLVNANLTNTASDPRSYTTTVAPVVGFVSSCWQYVDQFGVPLGSCAIVAKNPMFKVTSTGIAKAAQKTLSTMIQRFNVSPQIDGTLTANTKVNVQSASAVVDGRNYDCNGNNMSSDNNRPAATVPTGSSIDVNKPGNLLCDNGSGKGVCGGTTHTLPDSIGALLLPPTAPQSEIDALNAYLESIKVATGPDKNGPAFNGIVYVDGDYARPPNNSSGILIVHHRNASNHDVAQLGPFNSDITFKGLIIADDIVKINGTSTIIGAVIGFGSPADGVSVDDVNGTPDIKYSQCQIDKLSQYFPYRIVSGTWHEQ